MRRLLPFVVLTLSFVLSSFQSANAEQVTWTNAVGVSVSGADLTKTNSTSAWNSGAASTNLIRDGYGFFEFTATETNKTRMAGLSNGDSNQDYTDIDYGILIRNDGSLAIYEAGTYRGEFGSYSANDRFRQEVRYGVVKYYLNGSLFYTSTVVPKYPLRVDTSLYSQGATVSDAVIGNLVWTGASGVSIARDGLTKTGANSAWDAGAVSTNTIEYGDGYVEFLATETNKSRTAGFGNGDADQGLNDIEFGIQLRDDGVVAIYESGTSIGTYGSYFTDDRFRVEISGGTVRYYRNGSTLYTSAVMPTYPLRADTSLYTPGATLGSVTLETLIWGNDAGVTVQGANLTKTTSDAWNAHASSSYAVSAGDLWVEFTAIETDKRRVLGLKGSGTATDYSSIDFAIDLNASGVLEIFESGTSRGTYGAYAHGDRLRVEVQDGIVKYRKNGSVLYTSSVTPSYPLHGEAAMYSQNATLVDVAMGDFVWLNENGVQIFGNSIKKTTGSGSWNAGAVSTKAINSGYLEFTTTENNRAKAIGFNKGDGSQTSTDINHTLVLRDNGTAAIDESGTYRGEFGTYAPGDRYRIEVVSNVVKFYKNGSLLYTSGVTPSLPLRVDSSIYTQGGVLFNVLLSGTAVTDQLDAPSFTPGTGTYNTNQSVAITHPFSDVTIRYTTDGTDPTTSSTVYSAAISVTQSQTIKAKAWKSNYTTSNTATATYTLKVVTPGFSPGGGTYNSTQNVTITTSTSGATIRYTTDGADPTASSTLYSSAVSIDQSLTLKARAFKSGWTDSDVGATTYTMKVATPTLSPGGGSYTGAQNVTISTTTASATLRYTLDGTDPTSTSTAVVGGVVTMDRSNTLKVRGFRTGWTTSDPRHATYMITLGTVATPAHAPTPGTFTSQPTVTITTSTTGATIRYTTDGTDPTVKARIYTGPFPVTSTASIKAKAFKGDMTPSITATGLFVVDLGNVDTPRLSPGSGTYTTYQTVTVTTETSGATIHYTTNGTDPTETDPTVASGGTLNVNNSMTLRVKAWKSGMAPSGVGHGDYHLTGAVAIGGAFTIALKADGNLSSWGSNTQGQLGLGSTGGTHTTPSSITSTSDFVAVTAGSEHALGVKRNGTVWAWGRNANGQLGDGTTTMRTQPVQVNTLTNVVAVTAGEVHSLALKSDGTVWAWGNDNVNNYGTSPVQVSGLKGINLITAGRNHSFALQTDGEVSGGLWVWGYNERGPLDTNLGDGTLSSQATPTRVVTMMNVVDVNTSYDHTLAAKSDGTIWAWGSDNVGQLGDNAHINKNTPVQTATNINPADRIVSVGAIGAYNALVLQRRRDGTSSLWITGWNWFGGLGLGTYGPGYEFPVLSLMTGAWSTATGQGPTIAAIHLDGKLWMWGYNASGEVGDGTTGHRATPAAVGSFSLVDNSWLSTDSDGDGLSASLEIDLGSDPGNTDSNGDGIPDGIAVSSGKSATNPDMDGDGVPNAKEIELGTDPFIADSDADSYNDGIDCFPTDPQRHTCPASNPSDTTPPTINLITPTNAVLTGTTPPP